jgi:nucleotide-binding universal stress UspA family protein
MDRGEVSPWNLRDRHMVKVLEALFSDLNRGAGSAKIVVWAHNSHRPTSGCRALERTTQWETGEVPETFPSGVWHPSIDVRSNLFQVGEEHVSPFMSILIAADFSERSLRAFGIACSLARLTETRVHVLHVIEQTHVVEQTVAFGESDIALPSDPLTNPHREAILVRLRELYAPAEPIDLEYHLQDGLATDEIVRVAAEVNADLIVLGTHGRKGLERLLLGSVAETVLRKAACPVMVLRSAETGTATPRAIRAILHPTDFSKESVSARQVARELARDLGARLVLLHVAPVDVVVPEIGSVVENLEASRDALVSLRRQIDGPDLKQPVETELRQGDPTKEILNAARDLHCDLVVMGTHGRRGLGRILMGSVAETILRESTIPVFVVKGSQTATTPKPQSHPSVTLF